MRPSAAPTRTWLAIPSPAEKIGAQITVENAESIAAWRPTTTNTLDRLGRCGESGRGRARHVSSLRPALVGQHVSHFPVELPGMPIELCPVPLAGLAPRAPLEVLPEHALDEGRA